MNNGWKQVPLIEPLASMLAKGSSAWRKKNIRVLWSPEEKHPDGMWQHLSISHNARYPHWDEILDVRYSFFSEYADVVQLLPPKSEFINLHENCFHLWSPLEGRITRTSEVIDE